MKMRTILVIMVMFVVIFTQTSRVWAGQLDDRLALLEGYVSQLQIEIAALNANAAVIMAARGYLKLDETSAINGVIGPHVVFEGVNLHLQNGTAGDVGEGQPNYNPPNGLGNLIIGYDGIDPNGPLTPGDRSGSHNIVVGFANKFPGIYSLVHGWGNIASGGYSAVIAGDSNNAGEWNAVIGGYNNVAEGIDSVILGGNDNNASGYKSVIVGGGSNVAVGTSSVVSGGQGNTTNGYFSAVSGGQNNTASGSWGSVGGGLDRQALGDHDWVSGSLWENY